MNKKVLLVAIAVIVVIVLAIVLGSNMQYENKLKNIKDSRVSYFSTYNENKALAESYLMVYDIVDEDSYQNVKNFLYYSFDRELRNSIFPSVNYTGLNLHPIQARLIKCIGTNNESSTNTFLLEYNLTGVNYDQDITNLVTIENGKILKVVRVK